MPVPIFSQHNRVNNPKKIERVITVGTAREGSDTRMGLHAVRKKLDLLHVNTVGEGGRQLTEKELQPLLEVHLKTDRNCLVITDVGEYPREYKFEAVAANAKAANPNSTVVLLTSVNECAGEYVALEEFIRGRGFEPSVLGNVDYVFHFESGRQGIFSTMISALEDRMNYRNDDEKAVLVVEDRPNYYTSFLGELYKIIDSRAHVLLARDFEEAAGIISACEKRLIGAIVDVLFPKGGEMPTDDGNAWGIYKMIRGADARVPIVFQSAEREIINKTKQYSLVFSLYKDSPATPGRLREIICDNFGVGDFVFRAPSGLELARAHDLQGLYDSLRDPQRVPDSCLIYHSSNDHFANWLHLHGYKELAKSFKPIFTLNASELRKQLVELIGAELSSQQKQQ